MLLEHFADCVEWETIGAKSFTIDEIVARGYDLDLCEYPYDDEEILSPAETIKIFRERRDALDSKINVRLEKISALLQNIGGE